MLSNGSGITIFLKVTHWHYNAIGQQDKLGCTIQELHAARSIKSTLTFPLKSGQDKGSISYFLHFLHPLVFKTKGFWSKLHQFWKHTPVKQYIPFHSLSLLQFQNPFNHNPYCQGFWLGLLGLYVWILRNQEEMILPWTCCSKRSILV